MTTLAPISESEARQLALAWYAKLDLHAPMVELLPLLADEELEMRFPEGAVKSHAGFEGWYQRVIRVFFDETHRVKSVIVTPEADRARVQVVVEWNASFWNPPAPTSQRIQLDADQTWILARSPETQQPVIVTYIVNGLDYHPGSAKL